jgi:hypothetical protein
MDKVFQAIIDKWPIQELSDPNMVIKVQQDGAGGHCAADDEDLLEYLQSIHMDHKITHLTRAFFPLPCIFPKFPLIPAQIDPDCKFYDNELRYVTPHHAHMHNTRCNRRFNGSSTGMYWASTAIGRPISVSN